MNEIRSPCRFQVAASPSAAASGGASPHNASRYHAHGSDAPVDAPGDVPGAAAEAAGNFQGRPVGDIMLRGRSEPLRAFEPLQDALFKAPATSQYVDAFAKLEAGDATAMPAFAALVGVHADDALAGFHLKRLLNGAKGVRMQLE